MWYGCVLVATAASRVGGRAGGSGRATIDGRETSRCQLVGKRCGSAMRHAPPMLLLLLTHITPAQQQQQHSEPTEDTLLEAPSPRGPSSMSSSSRPSYPHAFSDGKSRKSW
ncbi:hypothetical protein NEUTE1DRAFT_101600 [Neurospora tetrasperma FGSC 2508]|uniref:Uncharacterized protein n=1 Tax=Neurospora tetrasperma (strain FGSC 2508 / ATCC MYA-4615 / P0657) TaxID=510951 RepID=F8MPL3_NEUT8|nr:uncharacterized protein NEUTE1DRAFT_101600 [Neurospora tetrasperma FGSC 2508]EGO56325.1 hypothetical protein NEUTE1DRAFT_101600 [Neurospora tetrasperma FGSC 2508]EGZ70818.1 hypothetical protein NEUTE2DRAFT_69615 [Neurospora tetrasperma FGSC 2509]